MGRLVIEQYYDLSRNATIVTVNDGDMWSRTYISDEELRDATDPQDVWYSVMRELGRQWNNKYNERIRTIAPTAEAESWRFEREGEVIEGEIVEQRKEIASGT